MSPHKMLCDLIGRYVEQLDDECFTAAEDNDSVAEEEILNPHFEIFYKAVTRDAYKQVCQLAFRIAIDLKLFNTGRSTDRPSKQKLFLLADLINFFGAYGFDISKRYYMYILHESEE